MKSDHWNHSTFYHDKIGYSVKIKAANRWSLSGIINVLRNRQTIDEFDNKI